MAASILVAGVHTNLLVALSLLFWIALSSKIVTWMSLWARIGQPVSGNGSSVFVSHTTQCNPWSHLCREAYSAFPQSNAGPGNISSNSLSPPPLIQPVDVSQPINYTYCGLPLDSAGGGNPLVVPTGLATVVPTELATSAYPGRLALPVSGVSGETTSSHTCCGRNVLECIGQFVVYTTICIGLISIDLFSIYNELDFHVPIKSAPGIYISPKVVTDLNAANSEGLDHLTAALLGASRLPILSLHISRLASRLNGLSWTSNFAPVNSALNTFSKSYPSHTEMASRIRIKPSNQKEQTGSGEIDAA
ncbi:hypothetical protein B0H19DRAFT_1240919 [Mycena capillaripes]|nr:hypothetical protein B0H19DRAFT_1240919 [Mycena capillaripes]